MLGEISLALARTAPASKTFSWQVPNPSSRQGPPMDWPIVLWLGTTIASVHVNGPSIQYTLIMVNIADMSRVQLSLPLSFQWHTTQTFR